MFPTHYVFRSGTNHPGEIRGTFDAGFQVGLSVNQISDTQLETLAIIADEEDEAEREGIKRPSKLLFVDSGAFGEVTFDPSQGKLVDKKPITDKEWAKRLDKYDAIASCWGRRCFVVAPDHVGDQQDTLARLRKYSERCFWLCELGANVIVPLQKGELSIVEFAVEAVRALQFNREELVFGIPCKKGATSPAELAEIAAALAEIGHPFPRFHLLGLAPDPGWHPGAKFLAYLGAIRRSLPDASVTCDSVRIAALFVREGIDKHGKPRKGRKGCTVRDQVYAEQGLDPKAKHTTEQTTINKRETLRRLFTDEAEQVKTFCAKVKAAAEAAGVWPTQQAAAQSLQNGLPGLLGGLVGLALWA